MIVFLGFRVIEAHALMDLENDDIIRKWLKKKEMASLEEVGSYILDTSMMNFLSLHCWLETQCPFMPRAPSLFVVNSVEKMFI